MNTAYILITGATGGLGKAFAVECASRGYRLFLTDLKAHNLEELANSLRRTYGVQVVTHACDLTSALARETLFNLIHAEGMHFWSLINVAGLDYEGLFYERTSAQIRAIIRLNIEATLEMTHAMIEFRDPYQAFRIVNVASLAAFAPMPVKATYAASKRFLLDFSLALRAEVAPLGASVTVLCPAGLPTTADCIDGIEAQGWLGQITTQNIGTVAVQTLDAALHGQAVVIPGAVNRALQILSALVPPQMAAWLLHNRWQSAHQQRFRNLEMQSR